MSVEESEPNRRSFAPRRGLPNGRAVIGALLVTVASVGAFVAATADTTAPTTEYLVLLSDISPGDTVRSSDVTAVALDLSPVLASHALRTTDRLDGATALGQLHKGSLLDPRDLNGAAYVNGAPITSVHELTLPVPRDRTPAALRRGDRVTVLAYTSSDGVLQTAAEDALVLAFDPDAPGIGASDTARLTLALEDAEEVVATTRLSYQALTVVLTTRALDDSYPTRFEDRP